MAGSDEEAQESEEVSSEEEEKKGGGLVKWIIVGVVALAVIGGGVFTVWSFFLAPPEVSKEEVAKAKQADPDFLGPIVRLESFTVNLADPGGKRYLKVTIEVELSGEEDKKELARRLPEVRDNIILALSGKSLRQIQSPAGKAVLRDELTARINAILRKGRARKTFFTEFVMQ